MSDTHESVAIEIWPSEDGQQVFSLRGRLDMQTAPSVKAALLDAGERLHHDLIVDLSQVGFLDSTGLGALIGSNKRAREAGGRLRIVAPEGQILRLLRITGLFGVLEVYATLDAAIVGADRLSPQAPLAQSRP